MTLSGKAIVLASGLFVIANVPQAEADPYRWCLIYGGRGGGASNCGFLTLEQCRASIGGNTDACRPNLFYDGVPIGERKPPRRRNQNYQ